MNFYIKMINDRLHNVTYIECFRIGGENLVFKVATTTGIYAVKFYRENIKSFNNEVLIYDYYNNNHVINTPTLRATYIEKNLGIAIIDWVDGKSLKNIVKEKNPYDYINLMISDMENIWKINSDLKKYLKKDIPGFDIRHNSNLEELFTTLLNNFPDIDISHIYDLYIKLRNDITVNDNFVINSDISMHECILKDNKLYWIDFEKYKLGDPNNDLARSFVSLTNGIYKDEIKVNKIFELYEQNMYYNESNFNYYLLEKVLSSMYTAPSEISTEEISFYISFIEEILNKNKGIIYS